MVAWLLNVFKLARPFRNCSRMALILDSIPVGNSFINATLKRMNLEDDIKVNVSSALPNIAIAIEANIMALVLLLAVIDLKAPKLIRNGTDIRQNDKRVSPSYTRSTAIDAKLDPPAIDSVRAR